MKHCFFILLAIAPLLTIAQQPVVSKLGDWISDTVILTGSLQGMAVNGSSIVLLRHGGQCLILDTTQQRCTASFHLPHNDTHCNNASFSSSRRTPGDTFPLLYVSSCFGDKACLVYHLDAQGAMLLQRIVYESDCFPVAQDWCLDADSSYLYAFGGRRGGMMYLKKFHLPDTAPSEIHLTDGDVLQIVPVSCVKVAQGSKIHHGLAYLPDGDEPGQYFLHIIDLASGQEIRTIDLNAIGLEPEGVDIADNAILISFHTPDPRNNAVYRFPL